MLYTSSGPASAPFHGGTLCLQTRMWRGPLVTSTGGHPGTCTASFRLDLNALASGAAGRNPQPFLLVPGQQVNCQWWGRDTFATGDYLSNALEFLIGP